MLGPEWKRYAGIRLASEDASAWAWNQFVWREAGQQAYRKLVGNWLAPPMWEVRYARFSGADVADRAEEWHVTIQGDGSVRQVAHQLPEQRPGARLTEEQARTLAQTRDQDATSGSIRPPCAKSKSSRIRIRRAPTGASNTPTPRVEVGKDGEARAMVDLAGDEVVGWGRYIFIPETWYRAERDRSSRLSVVRIARCARPLLCSPSRH